MSWDEKHAALLEKLDRPEGCVCGEVQFFYAGWSPAHASLELSTDCPIHMPETSAHLERLRRVS